MGALSHSTTRAQRYLLDPGAIRVRVRPRPLVGLTNSLADVLPARDGNHLTIWPRDRHRRRALRTKAGTQRLRDDVGWLSEARPSTAPPHQAAPDYSRVSDIVADRSGSGVAVTPVAFVV